jgi:dTDP-4-amino-4,6-dideoxygalactose transaminase
MDGAYDKVLPTKTEARDVTKPSVAARKQIIAKFRVTPISYAPFFSGSKPSDEALFIDKIRARMGKDLDVIPLGRARVGLHLLAKFAIRNGRKKILLAPFTIPDVANMLALAGAELTFFDSLPNSTLCDVDALLKMIDEKTGCVLISHYHVNEASTEKIAERCRQVGALLFDDCAIAFGGSHHGKPLGSITDASVFSLSAFKAVNFFWGGFISTRNREIAAFVRHAVAEWPRLKLKTYAEQASKCLKYDLVTRPTIFQMVVFPVLRNRAKKQNASLEWMRRIESETIDATLTSRPHLSAFREWNRKIGSLDQARQKRVEIARVYHRVLGQHMVSGTVSTDEFNEGSWVMYPVITRAGTRDDIRRQMMIAGFDIGVNYYPNVHKHEKFANAPGKSTNTEDMVTNSLHLPTHFGVTPEYAEAMASKLVELMARA